MKFLDLFSGIGGFSLGLERAGHETKAFCEIDAFCRRVLKKHWPHVPCYEDIRELTADRLRADGIEVDAICGGFPCQDLSTAGKRAGIKAERSGLWSEYARIISELRPRYAIVENVPGLLSLGLDRVLGDLAEIGFDAEWHCIPASAVGAPHRRDRIWIVAYPDSGRRGECKSPERGFPVSNESGHVADTWGGGSPRQGQPFDAKHPTAATIGQAIKLVDGRLSDQWRTEPNVGRVAHGVPSRVDRLRSLGNAVVPQIPEIIGRALTAAIGPTDEI